LSIDSDFRIELVLSYQEIGYHSAIFGNSYQFYEYACFLVEENDTNVLLRLHIGEVVTIITTEEDEIFAVIRSIFSHRNNNQRFAFVVVDQFEITKLTVFECPVYSLQKANRWRRIYPISVIRTSTSTHFIHYCSGDECIDGHNQRNKMYIRNMYFFNDV
jgi:hypothetical protein